MKRRIKSVITEQKELAPNIFSLKIRTEMAKEAAKNAVRDELEKKGEKFDNYYRITRQ